MRKLSRSTTSTVAAISMALLTAGCSRLVFSVANLPARFSTAQLKADIAYGADSRQKLDIYLPAGSTSARPVVVFWYGGAWTEGRKSDYRFVGAALAEQGYVVVLPYTSRDWQSVQVDARAPPTLLLHGRADQRVYYVSHTQQLHDALLAQGAHVEMELYAGAAHADTVQGFSAFRRHRAPTLERVLLFLQQRVPLDRPSARPASP